MFRRVVHLGEILREELKEACITPTEFSRQIDVPPNRVSQIFSGKHAVTGDTALRFGHWFGVNPHFWLNLQAQYDLAITERQIGEARAHLPTRAVLVSAPVRMAHDGDCHISDSQDKPLT